MFNHLDQRNQRQIRMQKSKIYKEMLDNQIFLNQQYRRKQEAKRIAQQKSLQKIKVKIPSQEKRQSYDRSFQRQKQYKKPKKAVHLPSLQDKQTFYQGHSNYIGTPNPKSRRRIISRIQTQQRPSYDLQSSNSDSDKIEDIQQILMELKSLNKQVKKVKSNIKKKHLNNLISSSRKPKKQRHRKIDLSYNYNENAQESPFAKISKYKSPSRLNNSDNSQNYRSIQTSHQDQLKNGKRMESLLSNSRNNQRQQERSLTQEDKTHTQDRQLNQKPDLQKEQRDRFLQILRKVKNRGESLFIKLSKFPKN